MPKEIDDILNALFGSQQDDISGSDKEHLDAIKKDLQLLTSSDGKEVRKSIIDDDYEKYMNKIRPFVHLWKLKDKQWVEQRNAIWKKIAEREENEKGDRFKKTEWGAYSRFFLKAKPRKSDAELYDYKRIAMTPYETPEELVNDFENRGSNHKSDLHEQLIKFTSSFYSAVPEAFHHVEFIAKALYNRDYVGKVEEFSPGCFDYVIFRPRNFVSFYASSTMDYLNLGKNDYLEYKRNRFKTGHERSFVEITIDYFLDTLEYTLTDKPEKLSGRIKDYGTGTLNDSGINGVKEISSIIESFSPDIKDKNREIFIEEAQEKILKNEYVLQVLAMPEKS